MAQVSKFVKGGVATAAGCALALTSLVLPAQAEALKTGEAIEPTAGTTQINLIGFNDFHGRITKIDAFAANVLDVQEPFGADNTVIISNGDQVGASEFESSVALDAPTIEALKELGVDAFTAGNHEFDAGYDTAATNDALSLQADFGHLLAANVTINGSPALDAYQIYDVQGFKVAVVGAVTASTPSGVSPDGIVGLDFANPVEAVNDYAAKLKDGDPANGEADIVIASYHEGGPVSGDPIDNNLSNATFAEIANTSDDVDAIFNAHTHQTYNYEYNGRPIVQASQYGDAVGQIVLDVDASGEVVASSSTIVETFVEKEPRVDVDTDLDATSKAVYDEVAATKQAALDEAEVLGAEQVGVVNEDISRAYFWENGAPASDNRGQESTLGSVVADSMMVWANGNTEIGADLSIMNPGGLRADIAGDGVLTYKDSQSVLPFVNNLSVITISGADLKTVLEEQWQVQSDGTVPGRPYLQLGLSSNVNYTYAGSKSDDPATTQGTHITSVFIDGAPLVDDEHYTVVLPSFLAAGGDNFYALNNAVEKFDTGSVDLSAFIAYVESLENKELKAEQTRNGFNVVGYFAEDGSAPVVEQGASHTFNVSDVDLHSLDHIANTVLVATIDGEEVGTAAIAGVTANGEVTTAEITITVPASLAAGAYTVELTANPSGSTVQVPLEVVIGDNTNGDDTANGDDDANGDDNGTTAPPTDDATGDDAAKGDDNGNATGDDNLAQTGADSNMIFGVLAAAAAAIALGAAFMLVRRQRNA